MHIDLSDLSAEEARTLLHDVTHLRVRTRSILSVEDWNWLTVWAVVCLGAAASALPVMPAAVTAMYWVVAVPIGLLVNHLVDQSHRRRHNVARRDTPHLAIGATMCVLCFGVSPLLTPSVAVVWIWIVLGAGFLSFSLLDHRRGAAVLLGGLVLTTAVAGVVVADTFALYPMLGLLYGLTLGAIAMRMRLAGRVAGPVL